MAETHTYKFNVSMSCSGCSGAIDRVLKKLDGKHQPLKPAPLSYHLVGGLELELELDIGGETERPKAKGG
jgi:copper chaperone CopZ